MTLMSLPPHKLALALYDNYNVRHLAGLLCLELHNGFCKIIQPVQMFRWLDKPTDSMVIPENVYVE
jgi:hypothetical protein